MLAQAKEREFHFTDRDFSFICKLVGEETGIVLGEAKRNMVYSRLARRLRALGIDSFGEYCKLLKNDKDQELVNFINAITTNLTSFFREGHHFTYLARTLLPELMERNAESRRLRIWSAGCSSGEEPYSIAMTVREAIPENSGWDIRILATDLDSNMVERAGSGVYTEERIESLPRQQIKRWFLRGKGNREGMVRVKPELQSMISFRQLNLLHDWPFSGPFDIIFCRNVVIYFSKDTQRVLVDRYADLTHDQSALFLGHSESLFKVSDRFSLVGNTIYRRNGK